MSEEKKSLISIAKYSSKGGRSENEDSCGYTTDGKGSLLVVVADGLGGEGQGALASRTAMDALLDNFKKESAKEPSDMSLWFTIANEKVLEMQTPECSMKTTAVALQVTKHTAMWGHVGDTRLYHFVNGNYESRTFDHSVSQMSVLRGEIKEEDIRGHVDRNRLLKALGRDEGIVPELSDEIELGDEVQHAFLLCTDGFWEYVLENEMEECLRSSQSAKEWLDGMIEILKSRAKADNDNNTAVGLIIG